MTTLLHLPPEIIHTILIYSREGPSLNLCCRSLHAVLRCAPNIIRARYLLASWHHAFECLPCDNSSQPPRFVPVVKSKMADATSSTLVLEYCLRFPICNQATLGLVQDMVIQLPAFGNYRLIHSLVHRRVKKSSREGRTIDGDGENEVLEESEEVKSSTFGSADHMASTENMVTPGTSYYLSVDGMPKRLFKDLTSQSTTYPSGQDLDMDDAEYAPLRRNLLSFGPLSELPPLPDLLLLLRILLLHRRPPLPKGSPLVPSAVNSLSGYPITKAVFSKSSSLLALLLTMGARVNWKDNLPLLLAGRSNWVHGLRLMIEQDEEEIIKRRNALDAIEEWLLDYTNGIPHLDSHVENGGEKETTQEHLTCANATLVTKTSNNHPTKRKRRRLSDRVRPDPRLLYEAVKAEALQVTDYLMNEKGVAPDMKTIRALDRLSAKASMSSSSTSTSSTPPSSLSRCR